MTSFPYTFYKIDDGVNKKLKKEFKHSRKGFFQVSPRRYTVPDLYRKVAADIYNFEVRPEDVWVATFPRSGTTLMQELVWLISNNLDYYTAANISLNHRFPIIDMSFLLPREVHTVLKFFRTPAAQSYVKSSIKCVNAAPSPRFIKSHLPFSLLPHTLVNTAKCVYVARNPKDVAVSYYHLHRLFRFVDHKVPFEKFWDNFEKDLIHPGPYWEHIRESWELRDHPNMLFLFYEDIITDWKGTINKVATFLGKSLTDFQVQSLAEHMHIDNFRKNPAVNMEMDALPGLLANGEQFIRKGQNNGWHKEFTPALNERADKWIAENLARIPGFAFPDSAYN